MQSTLLDKLGGDQVISELIDQFYYRALVDPKLRQHFLAAELAKVRFHQKVFFYNMFGGNAPYKGRQLKTVHKGKGITAEQFDAFLEHINILLNEMKVAPDLIKEAMDKIEQQRGNIVAP